MMKTALMLPPVALCFALFSASCAPQTKGAATITIHNKQAAQVSADGGTVAIDNGSQVSLPAGALAIGSEVTVQKVAAPSEFAASDQVSQAGSSVQIVAKAPDGSQLEQAAKPMTVSLVLDGASLALAVAQTSDNLCVLLKTTSNKLIAWRRGSITYDDATHKAQIQTVLFGVFGLVYCGQESLPGFADAGASGATGVATFQAALTVPSGFDATLGVGKACLLAISDHKSTPVGDDQDGDETLTVLATGEGLIGASDATFTLAVPQSQVVDGSDYLIGVGLFAGEATCPWKAGDNLKDLGQVTGMESLYVFKTTIDDLKAGVSGTLGADGAYKLLPIKVAVGGPTADAFPAFDESSVCFVSDLSNGHAMRTASIKNKVIGGDPNFTMSLPVGSLPYDGVAKVEVRVGTGCISLDDVHGDAATGKPYEIEMQGTDEVLYMAPITLQIANSSPLLNGKNGCLEIRKPASGGGDQDSVGRIEIALANGGSYGVYLPYLSDAQYQTGGVPKYDMTVTILDSGDCSDPKSSLSPVTLTDKLLNQTISVNIGI